MAVAVDAHRAYEPPVEEGRELDVVFEREDVLIRSPSPGAVDPHAANSGASPGGRGGT